MGPALPRPACIAVSLDPPALMGRTDPCATLSAPPAGVTEVRIVQRTPRIGRRVFLADLGRGAFALAVLSIAGCGPSATSVRPTSATTSTPTAAAPSVAPSAAGGAPPDPGAISWERVNLGFVSAYVLARDGEAAVVDTGTVGSADEIEASLGVLGLDWSAVGHLILTHHHGDHAGSAAAVMERAPDAVGYAGAEDVGAITVPRDLRPVADGDGVFGLTVVTTPGHTPGSICVLDPVGGVLIAGDALRTDGGQPALPSEQFTQDMDLARQSVVKLGALTFETLLVGHGDPLEGGASGAVAALASGG